MPDCSARDPGIESRCGGILCVYRKNYCDLQPWARAVRTFPAVPKSVSQLSLLPSMGR